MTNRLTKGVLSLGLASLLTLGVGSAKDVSAEEYILKGGKYNVLLESSPQTSDDSLMRFRTSYVDQNGKLRLDTRNRLNVPTNGSFYETLFSGDTFVDTGDNDIKVIGEDGKIVEPLGDEYQVMFTSNVASLGIFSPVEQKVGVEETDFTNVTYIGDVDLREGWNYFPTNDLKDRQFRIYGTEKPIKVNVEGGIGTGLETKLD